MKTTLISIRIVGFTALASCTNQSEKIHSPVSFQSGLSLSNQVNLKGDSDVPTSGFFLQNTPDHDQAMISSATAESIIKIPVNVVAFTPPAGTGLWKLQMTPISMQDAKSLIKKINQVSGFKSCGIEFYLASYQLLLKLNPSEGSPASTWTLEGQALKKVMSKDNGLYLMIGALHTRNLEVAGDLVGVNTGIVSSILWPSTITAAHELGHALGLKHEETPNNLMQPSSSPFKGDLSYEQCVTIRNSWTRR